jgi:hypothetical protein
MFCQSIRAACSLVLVVFPCSVAFAGDDDTAGKTAAVRLQTDPTGAEVFLDDAPLGKTPLTSRDLKPGLCSLTVKKDGFVPVALQMVLPGKRTIDLGTLPLAKKGALITVWRVGSPHGRNVPPAELPADLERLITDLGFKVKVRGLTAEDFGTKFLQAFREAGGEKLPDVIAGNNYLPFEGLQRDPAIKPTLLSARGVLNAADPFVFLVARSSSHAAARHLALTNKGMAVPNSFSWSLQEQKLNKVPGQLQSKADRAALENVSRRATAAYILGEMGEVKSLLHKDMLRRQGVFGADGRRGVVAGTRPLCVLGNSRLAFVLMTASFWNETALGCMEVLSVWVKTGDAWSLLTITNDPISLQAATEALPKLAGGLVEDKGEAVQQATLVSPRDGRIPPPLPGQRFGDFRWNPSQSEGVMEIVEFDYGRASRLFVTREGSVSNGRLWTTGGLWFWRVWSVGKDGQVVLSETWQFAN